MENQQLSIILKPINSTDVIPVNFKDTDTVRSIIQTAGISAPENSQLVCVAKGSQLQLDLSLAVQGIKPNDTIFVLYKKNKYSDRDVRRRGIEFSLKEEIRNHMRESERQQRELFEEALRVSDMSFLLFDYYKTSTNDYVALLAQSENRDDEEEDVREATLIDPEKPKEISEQPLPTCWPSNDEKDVDHNFLFDDSFEFSSSE